MTRLRQLLSPRFAAQEVGRASVPLSELQRTYLAQFRALVEAGKYRFADFPCPCGIAAEEVLVAEVDRYGLPIQSVLCGACGTVRTDPYLDDASLDHFYTHLYQELYGRKNNLNVLFSHQRSHYGERVCELYRAELPPGAAVLEVGCGTGSALLPWQERGYRVAGCDYSRELIDHGRSQGVSNLWTGPAQNAPPALAQLRFDLIYSYHVLEHVQHPAQALAELTPWLAPGGRILAVVPDLGRIDSHRNPAGNALTFFHLAHKFNYTSLALESIGRQAVLSAQLVTPPARDENALPDARHLPELWMEFSPGGAAVQPGENRRDAGQQVLHRLMEIERQFQLGQCPAQLQIAIRSEAEKCRPSAVIQKKPPKGVHRRRKWYDRFGLTTIRNLFRRPPKQRAA